ncbi:MAG TPA: hypothetical protein VE090_00830 [Methylomirabilota bacterium]|nr:hypothetical protein [Methylomirabilota bacterium]
MRERLEAVLGNHSIYQARRGEYETGQKIPFRVSPKPLEMSSEQGKEIQAIGNDITSYFFAADQLYRSDERVRDLLNTGKPEIFLTEKPADYLFIRPDLVITPNGFTICEIETSAFGLGLAEIVNRGYRQKGFETLVGDTTLSTYVQKLTPAEGTLVYSQKTKSYAGQMTFLAENVFSGEKRAWHAKKADSDNQNTLYRGFYLNEYLEDPSIKVLLDQQIATGNQLLPSPTPHMEEKALLSFVWDRRFEKYFQKELGDGAFNHLRDVIPLTWIVGQEQHVAVSLPEGIKHASELASLSRAKRAFVLKSSGFGTQSSWAEGVHFLHEKSAEGARSLLNQAQNDQSGLHVIQAFHRGIKVPMEYQDAKGENTPMMAKVRLTPYFSLAAGHEGKLIAIKATGCEKTDFLHASSSSINTAVSSV